MSGRAIAALKPVVLDKRSLHRMQLFAVRESFDRRNLVALVDDCECKTRIHAATIDQNRARAALAVIASLFGTRQMQSLAQGVEQRRARIDIQRVILAVDAILVPATCLINCRRVSKLPKISNSSRSPHPGSKGVSDSCAIV